MHHTYKIKNGKYYSANELYNENPAFFYGCDRSVRNIVVKKEIKNVIYAKENKHGEMLVYDEKYKLAKLYLPELWVTTNVPGYTKHKISEDVRLAPPIYNISDDQKFTDLEDNAVDITIRRDDNDEYYFKIADVGTWLDIKKLSSIISQNNNIYVFGEDYIYFNPTCDNTNVSCRIKKISYFTYSGLIKYLHTSRSKTAKKFITWANNILFTHQFGTTKQKRVLASTLIGVPVNEVRKTLQTEMASIACVYLFTIGLVKDLRKTMNISKKIPDDHIVCKYGKTGDLDRRTREHMITYGKLKGATLCLLYNARIDERLISDAEADIKGMFQMGGNFIEYDNHSEIVVVSEKMLRGNVKKRYGGLTKMYGGTIKDMIMELESKNKEIEIIQLKNATEAKNREIEIIHLKNAADTKNKEIEIMQLKYVSELQQLRHVGELQQLRYEKLEYALKRSKRKTSGRN
jgi:predicted SpoU family rRNA methylase